MISRSQSTCMVMPRAEVEMTYYARCRKCGKIIADDTSPLEVTTLKPEVKSTRIKCGNYIGRDKCNQINFVSHK